MLPLLLSASVKEVTSSLSTDPFSTLSSSPFTAFHAFLAFTVLVWLFESYLDLRQRACYSVATPPPQLSWVTPSEFALAQAYGRDKILYNLVKSSFDTLKLLTLLLLSVYPALWRLSAYLLSSLRLSPSSYPLLHSLLFFSLEQTLDQLTSLPFSYYKTFTLEQLHGFNKSTRALFFSDQAKTFALLLVIGLPILALLLTVIDSAGPHFYVYCWAAVLVIQLLALTVYPVLIQPLFNRVEPLEQGSLRSAIEALAARVHFPLTRLYRIDGSKRSSHSNAYFYGFFSNKRIVIFDTLINQSSQEEVVAVLARTKHSTPHSSDLHPAPSQHSLLTSSRSAALPLLLSSRVQMRSGTGVRITPPRTCWWRRCRRSCCSGCSGRRCSGRRWLWTLASRRRPPTSACSSSSSSTRPLRTSPLSS